MVHGWPGGSAGRGPACRAGKVRPPSRETLTCGVPASRDATDRHAARALGAVSAPCESPSRRGNIASASCGVSWAGNRELARAPVILVSGSSLLLEAGWLSVRDPNHLAAVRRV